MLQCGLHAWPALSSFPARRAGDQAPPGTIVARDPLLCSTGLEVASVGFSRGQHRLGGLCSLRIAGERFGLGVPDRSQMKPARVVTVRCRSSKRAVRNAFPRSTSMSKP